MFVKILPEQYIQLGSMVLRMPKIVQQYLQHGIIHILGFAAFDKTVVDGFDVQIFNDFFAFDTTLLKIFNQFLFGIKLIRDQITDRFDWPFGFRPLGKRQGWSKIRWRKSQVVV